MGFAKVLSVQQVKTKNSIGKDVSGWGDYMEAKYTLF